jgi:glycosyltransferase involved in cell wall biosynthesis
MEILIPFYDLSTLDFYSHLVKSLQEYSSGVQIHIAYVTTNSPIEQTWLHTYKLSKIEIIQKTRIKTLDFLLSKKSFLDVIKYSKPDVIFVLSELWNLEFSSYYSQKLKVPFVVWMRGDHRKVREVKHTNILKRYITNFLEVNILNKAYYVIPNSLMLREKLRKWGVKETKITEPVYNGVDTKFFKPMDVPRSTKFTVGYAGRISPEKRVDVLIRIAKRLKNDEIKFLMAGSKQMNIEFPENVKYLGRLKFTEMPLFYNMIDLLILPSLTESFPSVILEAYASGKPVLVAKEAFPQELKIFGSVSDVKNFEKEILRLKSVELKTLGIMAREYVEKNFTWDRFATRILYYLRKATGTCK